MRAVWVVALIAIPAFYAISFRNTYRPEPSPFDPKNPTSGFNQGVGSRAREAFARGIELRTNSAKARPEFAQAAKEFDTLWNRGFRTPALALYRARAHRLAGDLPGAILALREGLHAAPADRDLQKDLADARGTIIYPAGSDLERLGRLATSTSITSLLSPSQALLLAGTLWLAACLACTRYFMTRSSTWLWIAISSFVMLLLLGGLWWKAEREHSHAPPFGVIADDVVLRSGNAASYPPRLESQLPRGVEVTVLGERGGWFHVELSGGVAGWVPAEALLTPAASEPPSPPRP